MIPHYLRPIKTKPFEVGKQYKRLDGKIVTCIKVNNELVHHSTAQFDDYQESHDRVMAKYANDTGAMEFIMKDPEWDNPKKSGHRYNRDQDRGRCTASPDDDPLNVIPEPHDDCRIKRWLVLGYNTRQPHDNWSTLPIAEFFQRYNKRNRLHYQPVFLIELNNGQLIYVKAKPK